METDPSVLKCLDLTSNLECGSLFVCVGATGGWGSPGGRETDREQPQEGGC